MQVLFYEFCEVFQNSSRRLFLDSLSAGDVTERYEDAIGTKTKHTLMTSIVFAKSKYVNFMLRAYSFKLFEYDIVWQNRQNVLYPQEYSYDLIWSHSDVNYFMKVWRLCH